MQKSALRVGSTDITWSLVRNADSLAPLQTYRTSLRSTMEELTRGEQLLSNSWKCQGPSP